MDDQFLYEFRKEPRPEFAEDLLRKLNLQSKAHHQRYKRTWRPVLSLAGLLLAVVALFSLAIFACFVSSMIGGISASVFLLPTSGLFMPVLYPTINSKGISCFRKAEHGAIAGVILFFTCAAAVLGPLAMGAISDSFGHAKYGFILATGFAGLLFISLLLNWITNPTRRVLRELDATEYHGVEAHGPLQEEV